MTAAANITISVMNGHSKYSNRVGMVFGEGMRPELNLEENSIQSLSEGCFDDSWWREMCVVSDFDCSKSFSMNILMEF